MSTHRIFVAIPLSEEAKDALMATIPPINKRELRWTAKENLHFTLSFIGDRSDEELERIKQTVAEIAAERYPFRMRFKGFKTMYKNRKPSMVWAVFRDSESYDEFSAEFSNALEGDSLNEPIPHVTLGRVKNRASGFIRTPKMQHITPFELDVDHVELWESTFGDDGVTYHFLESFPMKPEPDEALGNVDDPYEEDLSQNSEQTED